MVIPGLANRVTAAGGYLLPRKRVLLPLLARQHPAAPRLEGGGPRGLLADHGLRRRPRRTDVCVALVYRTPAAGRACLTPVTTVGIG
ncbi:MAG: hypothetical protein U5R31_15020 [Acidimicrobiia bacterium]|nr:hypothetical protein [Acidimicrobiia bacterium]